MAILHVFQPGTNTPPFANKLAGATKIQTALDAAAPGDTVLVHGAASFSPPVRFVYKENLSITKGVTLTGVPNEWPIIDGAKAGRVISIEGFIFTPGATVTIEGFEIRNGRIKGFNGYGGGICVLGVSTIIIRNNCIHGNSASEFGGGIFVSFAAGVISAEITRNHIHDNYGKFGGGVCKRGLGAGRPDGNRVFQLTHNRIGPNNRSNRGGGVLVHFGDALIRNNEIFDNKAQVIDNNQASGGGINVRARPTITATLAGLYLWTWSDIKRFQNVRLVGNRIHGNRAQDDGGGMTVEMAGCVTAEGNSFERNMSLRDDAGGIYVTLASSLELEAGNLVKGNRAQENGGGLHVTCGSRAVISGNNIFEDNTTVGAAAGYTGGGGISVRHSELRISGSVVIRRNTTTGYGGGIFALTTSLSFTNSPCERDTAVILDGTLIDGNTAGLEGGGIAIVKDKGMVPRSETRIEGCVILNNRATRNGDTGIYIYNPVSTTLWHYQPKVRQCHVAGHTNGQRAAGIWIEGSGETQALVEGCRVTGNHWGLALIDTGKSIVQLNEFVRQTEVNMYGEDARFSSFAHNQILGGGTTKRGVWLYRHRGGAVVLCNIAGHTEYGMLEEMTPAGTGPLAAPSNWWGNPAGPTQFPGPGAGTPPGDMIRQNILWVPPLGTVLVLASPAPTSLPVPTLVPPPPQDFAMHSEYDGGIKCE